MRLCIVHTLLLKAVKTRKPSVGIQLFRKFEPKEQKVFKKHKILASRGHSWYTARPMATTPTRKTRFSRRVPDHVTDELVNVLSRGKTHEFNALFGLVYENLKLKNAVSGGEEMLRLRSYEKLQNLVSRGMCAKVGKTYRGLDGLAQAHSTAVAARAAAAAAAR